MSRSIITSARPTNVAPCAASVGYGNYRLRASEVSGCADGVKVRGTVEIDGSFIHNTRPVLWDLLHPQRRDAVQRRGGSP